MTDREKAIVMAHTGICMLVGDKFQIFHKYVEDIMGRPIWTHEMGLLADEIKEKSKADFIALCADESSSENPNKWIPVETALPDKNIRCLVAVGRINYNYTQIATYSDLMGTIDHRIFYQGEYGHEDFRDITQYVKAWQRLPEPYKSEILTVAEGSDK